MIATSHWLTAALSPSRLLSKSEGLHVPFKGGQLFVSACMGYMGVHTLCSSAAGCDCMRIADMHILFNTLRPQIHDLIPSALSQSKSVRSPEQTPQSWGWR